MDVPVVLLALGSLALAAQIAHLWSRLLRAEEAVQSLRRALGRTNDSPEASGSRPGPPRPRR